MSSENWQINLKKTNITNLSNISALVEVNTYNDAGSVSTLVTDELQIERNASDDWERSV